MIFISGIHGVGKSYFCNMVKDRLGIQSYSASELISTKRNKGFTADKLVPDIDDNQVLLLEALNELRHGEKEFILDGHFCFLNEHGNITRIPQDTYTSLNPNAIVLLTEKLEIIAERRVARDGSEQSLDDISAFQEAEFLYAQEIASLLQIPLVVSKGAGDLEKVMDFIGKGDK